MVAYKHLLIDGKNTFFRTLGTDLAKVGESSGAELVYVFVRQLAALARQHKEARIICCWEGGHSPLRKALLPQYKVRPPDPDPEKVALHAKLTAQIPVAKELLALMGIASLDAPGLEGDDVVATLALHLDGPNLIVSNDSDFYQFLNDGGYGHWPTTHMHRHDLTAPPMTCQQMIASKALPPHLWAAYKACQGTQRTRSPGALASGR